MSSKLIQGLQVFIFIITFFNDMEGTQSQIDTNVFQNINAFGTKDKRKSQKQSVFFFRLPANRDRVRQISCEIYWIYDLFYPLKKFKL